MDIENIKIQLQNNGCDVNDFIIELSKDGYTVTPKWFYEIKQIAKQEDKPIIEDTNTIAELTAFTSMDKDEIAEILVNVLQRIDKLEEKING